MSFRTLVFATFIILCINTVHAQSSASTSFDFGSILKSGDEARLPVLKYPSMLPDEAGMLFSWEIAPSALPSNVNIAYEIKFYEWKENELTSVSVSRKPVLSKTIFENSFLYDAGYSVLVPGQSYLVVVDTKIEYPDKTEILDGTPNAISFSYVPECTAPAKVQVSGIGTDNFTVRWSGAAASENGYHYEIRYRKQGASKSPWTQVLIKEGSSLDIEGLTPKTTYELEIRRICPPVREFPEMYSDWTSVKDIRLPAEKAISLPPFDSCGAPFTVPTCGDIKREGSFDTLYVGGFPIEVSEISSNGTTWTGEGYVPLPFGNTLVKVEWTNVQIDINGNVCSGTVKGISDDPMYYPDLDPGPIAFGGEICLPTPSATPSFDSNGVHSVTGLPWDEYGFGSDGTYDKVPPYPGYQPGGVVDTSGMFDPWGFDSEGHYLNGDTVNQNGCTQEQMNSLLETPPAYQPPPCNVLPPPYEWLDTTGTPGTAPGGQLANEVADSLEYWLGQVLDELQSFYLDSIDTQSGVCDGIRTTMNGQLTTLGYEREFILGPNDEYFNEGMYKHFTKRPQPMAVNMDRDQTQIDFEANHIALYDCDKKLASFSAFGAIIDSLRNEGLSDFADELLKKIRQFNAEDAAFYAVHENLIDWLREQCKGKINEAYESSSTGYQPALNDRKYEELASTDSQANPDKHAGFSGNFLADHVTDGELTAAFFQSFNTTPDDISFQFRQGWREVNGINRAYYLDAMAQQRLMANAMPHMLTGHDSTLMPIIVKNRASDGRLYQVYLDSIVFTPSSAVMNAYIVLELPNNGQKIVFESHALTFGPTGFPTGTVSLELANDVAVRLSNAVRLVIQGNSKTFVSIDCQGFAGLGVEADVELCRSIVKPIDGSGAILPDPDRVSGHLQVFVPTWTELYVEITMDPFVVTEVEDIQWHIDTVVFDYSETVSLGSPGTPPAGYSSPFAGPSGFQPKWEGVFIQNFSATLPNHFSQAGSPITIGVEKVIIDDLGFSGGIYAAPLLSLADGNAGGWAFSVDTFEIAIAHNTLVNAKFNGLINVPIFKNAGACGSNSSVIEAADCFKYKAFIEPGNVYDFVVKSDGDYCVDMWKAGQVTLDSCSSISMHMEGGQFTAVANLTGSVTINANIGNGMSVNVPEISFQEVKVSNKAPYFSPGEWEFPDGIGADFGGFELVIDSIKMVESSGNPALRFRSRLVLSNAVNLAAEGSFLIVGEKVETNGRQRWKFKELKVNEICLENLSFPGVDHLSGCINFYENNSTYGSGFRGQVDVAFTGIGGVKAVAQFGKVNNNKYFFIDALFCSDSGIPMGPVNLYGMGGGIYHNMTRPESGAGLGGLCGPNATIPTTIGSSISGITYTPSTSGKLGLKLTVVLGLQKKEAFNANATFEILFNTPNSNGDGGGLSNVWIYGNAKFMDELNLQGGTGRTPHSPPIAAKICANVALSMNFNTSVFSGQIEVFLDAGIIKGAGDNNLLVNAEVYLSPEDWYIKAGKPDARAGIEFAIPGVPITATAMSYLQIGKGVDPMPALPTYITQLTGLNQNSGFTGQIGAGGVDDQRGSTLDGFIFGSDIEIGVHDKQVAIFTATLSAKLGFDVSVLNYPGVTCSNTGDDLGINGWYANGQVYAALAVKLKIKVKVFKKRKTFTIFDMAAAVALQAGLPNPFWAEGGVGANYNLLGGLVKGHCDFQVSIGEKCQVSGGGEAFEDVPIIGTTSPYEGEKVSPYKKPFVNFNFPIGQPFSIADFDGNSFNYTIRLDYANVKMDNWNIPVHYDWTPDRKGLSITPHIILPKNDSFLVAIKVHVDSSGINIHEEERIVHFTTNGINLGIRPDNVAGSYPMNGQYNFYKDELTNHQGYLKLIKGQPDQFYEQDGVQMLVRLKKSDGACMTVPMAYNASEYEVTFPLPTNGFFVANGIYKMDLIKVPGPSNGQTVNPCATLPPTNPGGTTPAQSPNSPQSPNGPTPGGNNSSNNNPPSSPPTVETLYTAYFRVSQYNTFKDKMAAWDGGDHHVGNYLFENYSSGFEPFDKFELGYEGAKPLVEVVARISETPWFDTTTQIKALYSFENPNEYFDITNAIEVGRDVSLLGWPPNKAVNITQSGIAPKVTSTDFQNGNVQTATNLVPRIFYNAGAIALVDKQRVSQPLTYAYYDYDTNLKLNLAMAQVDGWYYQSHPCNFYKDYPLSEGLDTLFTFFPQKFLDCYCGHDVPAASGNFPITVKYRLPGKSQVSSFKDITLVKP